jgi:hypothetical protein
MKMRHVYSLGDIIEPRNEIFKFRKSCYGPGRKGYEVQ